MALNQISKGNTKTFKPLSDFLVALIKLLRSQSDDNAYLILHEVLLAKILPEMPLTNYSLIDFFRFCVACAGQLSPVLFQTLFSYSVNNLRQFQPNVSENFLRFQVLNAFTVFAEQTGLYKD